MFTWPVVAQVGWPTGRLSVDGDRASSDIYYISRIKLIYTIGSTGVTIFWSERWAFI